MMTNDRKSERAHVAISPTRSADNGLLKAIGEVTGQAVYDLRLKLKGSLPRSIMLCPTLSQAEAVADRLRDLGLTTIVYRQDDLPPSVPFAVHKLGRIGSALRLTDRRGDERTIEMRDVGMLVYGRREKHSSHGELKCERRYHYGGMGPGAVGTSYMHAEVQEVHHVDRDDFLLLFGNDPKEPAIEFASRGMDYACLGRHLRRTNPENHQVLVMLLRKLLGDVPFDGRLSESHCGNKHHEAFFNRNLSPDSSWAYATLIYWEMLAERNELQHFNGSTRRGAD